MARFKYSNTILDGAGNSLSSIGVTVQLAGTSTDATVYNVPSGGSPISVGPQITSDGNGKYEFWIDDGDYSYPQAFKITFGSGGATFTEDNIEIIYQPPPDVTLWGGKNISFLINSMLGGQLFDAYYAEYTWTTNLDSISIWEDNTKTTLLLTITYTYTGSNLTQAVITDSVTTQTITYTYDGSDNLLTETSVMT